MAFSIVNLPQTMKIRTEDNQIMELNGKLFNESVALREAFEMHDDPEVSEIPVPVESADFKNALNLLSFFDLDKPYHPELDCRFLQADQPPMKFLHALSDDDKAGMEIAIDYLECERLDDCLRVYFCEVIHKYLFDCYRYAEEKKH
uniref:BTB domain-containing protein n=1 Tax=Panagrellus redivivus TaxID=6233 RepID=A0A7E4W726_PANRE